MADLYSAHQQRGAAPFDQAAQDALGPLEHEQFMHEVTQRSPLMGTLLAAGVPLYTILKAIGAAPGGTGEMATSRPSMEEIGGAWTGYGRGLMDLLE